MQRLLHEHRQGGEGGGGGVVAPLDFWLTETLESRI